MSVENVVKAGENDFGTAIQRLIEQNVRGLFVSYLAKVQKVNESTIDIVLLQNNQSLVIPNVMVALPYSSKGIQVSSVISQNDIGLCIVCDSDITGYKQSGSITSAITARKHDIADSIFLPLSLYNSTISKNAITASDSITIQAETFAIKNSTTSLLTLLNDLVSALTSATTINAVNGSPLTFSVNTIAELNKIKNELSSFFSE